MNKRHIFYSLPVILLLTVVVAGWFATDHLGNKARQEIIRESRASLLSVFTYVSSTLTNIEGAVQSLAGSPWIASALMSKRDRDIENANGVLDRYNSALNASVSYLMDTLGTTVASSNREDPDSFVGKSYLFRPYFQEAAKGLAGRYFALGVTSGKRGFYASYPVKGDRPGKVLGVVTMKKDLDEMEGFFKRYPFCFLVNPNGIIFLSSSPAMVMKSLYPLDKAVQEQLIASRQFGNKPFETVFLKKDFVDNLEVTLEGKGYFVSKEVIDSDGWSIVLLTPTDHIRIYKLIGILATISVCFLIVIFSGIIYFTGRTKETIRQSEEDKRLLLNAAGEGILGVDAAGLVTFVNPAALHMLGFAEEEMLGQSMHDLIHHAHEDGSNYPAEECHICSSYTVAADSRVVDEVLWRKDGCSFPVDYSSMPITKDGKAMGAVVTFRNIIQRKKMEKSLLESENKFKNISEESPVGIYIIQDGIFQYVNKRFADIHGYTIEAITGKLGPSDLAFPEDLSIAEQAMQKRISGEVERTHTIQRALKKNGDVIHLEVYGSKMSHQGKTVLIGSLLDITERIGMEEQMRNMAYHDALTGLPNRLLFNDRLDVAMNLSRRKEERLAVMMLDIDRFKEVNDSLGHDFGDMLLMTVAGRISSILRKSDTVARMGGDEFMILLPEIAKAEDAMTVAEKICLAVREPIQSNGKTLNVSVSIGISIYPDHANDITTLLKYADIVLYSAKEGGRNKAVLFPGQENTKKEVLK